nr:competence type IV pilus minor pilin ComGF [Streptococcus ovuberis]
MLKNRLSAFTLLEALVALLVIASSLLVIQSLSKNLAYDMAYQSRDTRKDWLVFSDQLQRELDQSRLVKVENNRLYVTKFGQELAFGQSKKDDFRKTNWSLQGYQPMLQDLKDSQISQSGDVIELNVQFNNGLERTFIYGFDQED